MNKYESVLIIKPNAEIADQVENEIRDLITAHGTIEKCENLGKKKLAYTVKGNDEGNYIIFYYNAETAVIGELEEAFRANDNIIKFMTIKIEDEEEY